MKKIIKYRCNKFLQGICLLLFSVSYASVFSQSGYLYGTTYGGGKYNYGVLFRYNIATNRDTVLVNLDSTNDGAYPLSNVILASNGQIFGNTFEGGKYGYGTIFSYNPVTGKDTVWKNFDSVHDGSNPIGGLIQSKSGLIYGTTPVGIKRFGDVFSLNINTGQFKVVYTFDSVHGSHPWDAPFEAPSGLLYGTTNTGGTHDDGVIFCVNPLTGKDTTCFNFDDTLHGQNPDGSLCLANDNLLYGMTNSGGAFGYGVLFGFDMKTGLFKHTISFNDTDGAYAYSNVIQATDGLIYGMTEGGGVTSGGILFSYKPGDNKDSVCSRLLSATGANPFGTIIQAPGGLLYGTTAYGGPKDDGVIFSYDPITHVYNTLFNLDDTKGTGYYPNAAPLYVSDSVTGINELKNNLVVNVYPNPGSGVFNFELKIKNEELKIEVFNILGEKVFSLFAAHHSPFTINLTGQPDGIYQYRIVSEKGELITSGKLVVER